MREVVRLGGSQGRRQLHGDVVVAASGAPARARGGVAAHHHAGTHHLQPAPWKPTTIKLFRVSLVPTQHLITHKTCL